MYNKIKPFRSFYLPSGRIIVSQTKDGHFIESTEMRDVTVEGKNHAEVRETFDPKIIWKHLAPIEKKWLLTVSTQVGCTYSCKFCDVGNLGFKRNLSIEEILEQVKMLIDSTPEITSHDITKAKIGFARMGEPMQNLINVLHVIRYIVSENFGYNIKWLPCFNSIVPQRIKLGGKDYCSGLDALSEVLKVKELNCDGFLHLQISVNSTDESKRKELFDGANVTPIKSIIELVNDTIITNRTVTLNFISMKGVEISIEKLIDWGLNPNKFTVKIIPLNYTLNSIKHTLQTEFNYQNFDELKRVEANFREKGIPVVTDAIAKCEEAGLCCGQLVNDFYIEQKTKN